LLRGHRTYLFIKGILKVQNNKYEFWKHWENRTLRRKGDSFKEKLWGVKRHSSGGKKRWFEEIGNSQE